MKSDVVVKWIETEMPNHCSYDQYPQMNPKDFEKHHEGRVLGVVPSIWNTKLVVACTDGRVRKVDYDKVVVMSESQEK